MEAINWSNVTDLGQTPGQANVASGGSFWVGMLYMIWIILILIFIGYGFEVSILAASFICLILGLLLVYGGLVAWEYLITFLAVLLFMFLYIIWSSKKTRQ